LKNIILSLISYLLLGVHRKERRRPAAKRAVEPLPSRTLQSEKTDTNDAKSVIPGPEASASLGNL
jgi:hypothetical protein